MKEKKMIKEVYTKREEGPDWIVTIDTDEEEIIDITMAMFINREVHYQSLGLLPSELNEGYLRSLYRDALVHLDIQERLEAQEASL